MLEIYHVVYTYVVTTSHISSAREPHLTGGSRLRQHDCSHSVTLKQGQYVIHLSPQCLPNASTHVCRAKLNGQGKES